VLTYTIEEIRRALDAAPPEISLNGIISKGTLTARTSEIDCTIHLGWDLLIANLCDRSWGAFNVSLLRHIRKLEAEGVDIAPLLESAQLEDNHWRWLDKTLHYRGDCYKWFFLIAENYPQAACLVYHPKASVVGAGDIFYVEYVATAPWNRENVLSERVFKGVGPKLLERVISYAKDDLKLRPGFSLHSLPKAVEFYEKIGMKAFPQYDKEGLKFFEWVAPESHAKG
jgi:GNAT superfamily N-acetyltransferase